MTGLLLAAAAVFVLGATVGLVVGGCYEFWRSGGTRDLEEQVDAAREEAADLAAILDALTAPPAEHVPAPEPLRLIRGGRA